jgi:O-antigen biosynthesis protein
MVSIIIPNYNGAELLRKNLPFVLKAKGNPENQIDEIIVVDDGSTDESVEVIKKEFPQVSLVKHVKNRGFAAAVNTGVRSSKGVLVALVNTDMEPTEDFLVAAIIDFKDNAVFGVSFHEEGYGWGKGVFRNGFIEHDPGTESESTHNTFWVSGGSGVFRRDLWFELGGLDEMLFAPFYWEDVDLSYRALKRGYKLLWEPKSHVRHEHEATIGKISLKKRNYIQERNQLLFIWKNLTSANYLRQHVAGLFKRIIKHPGYLKILLMALLRVPTLIKSKRKIRKLLRVSDEAVFNLNR